MGRKLLQFGMHLREDELDAKTRKRNADTGEIQQRDWEIQQRDWDTAERLGAQNTDTATNRERDREKHATGGEKRGRESVELVLMS